MTTALDEIRHLFTEGTLAGLSDGELLERFAVRRDGEAFAAIVARHGAMVLSVCRSTLGRGDVSGAEDAFQATILLCDIHGLTRDQAAEAIGCPPGTVAGRLARARKQLRDRLARRGVHLSSAWPAAMAMSTGDLSRLLPACDPRGGLGRPRRGGRHDGRRATGGEGLARPARGADPGGRWRF